MLVHMSLGAPMLRSRPRDAFYDKGCGVFWAEIFHGGK